MNVAKLIRYTFYSIFQVNFVIDFGMELLNPCVNIMLQFKVKAKIGVRSDSDLNRLAHKLLTII